MSIAEQKGEGRENLTHDMEQETGFEITPKHEPRVMRIVDHDKTLGFAELFRSKLPRKKKKGGN